MHQDRGKHGKIKSLVKNWMYLLRKPHGNQDDRNRILEAMAVSDMGVRPGRHLVGSEVCTLCEGKLKKKNGMNTVSDV